MNSRFAYVNAWFNRHRIDISVWTVFILYESLIAGIYRGSFDNPLNYVIHYSMNIALFYMQALRVLPWAFRKEPYWRLPLGIVFTLCAYIIIVYYVDILLLKYTNISSLPIAESSDYIFLLGISWRGLYFTLLGTGYYFIRAYLKKREQLAVLERERLTALIEEETLKKNLEKAKNAYLSAQINPHFLFNTLNFIYLDVRKYSSTSADLIECLADIMRYGVDADYYAKPVPLADEMEQVINLVKIHQLLKNDSLQIQIIYDESMGDVPILPQTILPLVENLFKHGDVTLPSCPAIIEVGRRSDYLMVRVINKIEKNTIKIGKHSGLKNVTDRLRYTYDQAATLECIKNEQEETFTAILKISLTDID